MRARLHVRGRLVGFFREGTHEVCDARQTRQLLPATLDAVDRLVAGAAVARPRRHPRNRAGGKSRCLASRRASRRAAALDARSLERLAATDGLTGLSSPAGTHGDVRVTDAIVVDGHPPVLLERHVLAFFQGNRYLVNQLVARVMNAIPARERRARPVRRRRPFRRPGLRPRAAPASRRSKAIGSPRPILRANAAQTDGAAAPHPSVGRGIST